jgi:hypothetical protein
MPKMLKDAGAASADQLMKVELHMKKPDIAALERAYRGI